MKKTSTVATTGIVYQLAVPGSSVVSIHAYYDFQTALLEVDDQVKGYEKLKSAKVGERINIMAEVVFHKKKGWLPSKIVEIR